MLQKIKEKKLIILICSLIAIGFLLFFLFGEKYIKSNEIAVKIISPYNCTYQIKICGDSINIQSNSFEYRKINTLNIEIDTLVRQYDTLSNTLINSKIESYILKILSKDIEIDTSSIKDGYVFELYYNYALIKKKNGGDEDFNSIIKVLKPLIKNEGIQCCEFFIMFDSIDK